MLYDIICCFLFFPPKPGMNLWTRSNENFHWAFLLFLPMKKYQYSQLHSLQKTLNKTERKPQNKTTLSKINCLRNERTFCQTHLGDCAWNNKEAYRGFLPSRIDKRTGNRVEQINDLKPWDPQSRPGGNRGGGRWGTSQVKCWMPEVFRLRGAIYSRLKLLSSKLNISWILAPNVAR